MFVAFLRVCSSAKNLTSRPSSAPAMEGVAKVPSAICSIMEFALSYECPMAWLCPIIRPVIREAGMNVWTKPLNQKAKNLLLEKLNLVNAETRLSLSATFIGYSKNISSGHHTTYKRTNLSLTIFHVPSIYRVEFQLHTVH